MESMILLTPEDYGELKKLADEHQKIIDDVKNNAQMEFDVFELWIKYATRKLSPAQISDSFMEFKSKTKGMTYEQKKELVEKAKAGD